MVEILDAAGYDTADEGDMAWALIAWNAAVGVHEAASQGAGDDERPASPKVGRNAPCPCGSGKKFKRCCLAKATDAAAPRRSVVGTGPPPNPRLVPNLADIDAAHRDLASLTKLFRSDPALDHVRFASAEVMRFLDRVLPEDAPADAPDASELMDELAFRFVEETGATLPDDLGTQLVDAARRPGRSLDELRALAAGVIYATAGQQQGGAEVNPLVAVVFRLTAAEAVQAGGLVQDAAERLNLGDANAEDLLAHKGEIDDVVQELVAGASPETLRQIERQWEKTIAPVREAIRDGRFPPLLPMASVLPTVVTVRARAQPRPGKEATHEAVQRSIDALGEEDAALYGASLDRWLAEYADGADAGIVEQVELVRMLVTDGSLAALDWELVMAALRHGLPETLPDEGLAVAALLDDTGAPSVAGLEGYGDLLRENGYPALARKAWRLCAELGPLPDSVSEKLAATES